MIVSTDPISGKTVTIPGTNEPRALRGLLSQLVIGEVLEGRTIEHLGDQRILVSLKDKCVVAETQRALLPGETFMVQVKQLSPKIVLSLLSEPIPLGNKLVSQIKTLLTYQIALGRLIEDLQKNIVLNQQLEWDGKEKLQTILSSLVFNQSQGDYLKAFISASGLLYENKIMRYLSGASKELPLDDLKGLLLRLVSELNVGSSNNSSLANLVSSGVKNIELQQYLNLLSKETGDFYLLQIPVAFSQTIETVHLYLYDQRDKSGRKEKKDCFTLVFLLSLEGLGEVKIVTFIADKNILCRVTVAQEKQAEFIQRLLPQLKDRLENFGYQVEALSCSAAKETPDQLPLPGLDLDAILERINSLNLWI